MESLRLFSFFFSTVLILDHERRRLRAQVCASFLACCYCVHLRHMGVSELLLMSIEASQMEHRLAFEKRERKNLLHCKQCFDAGLRLAWIFPFPLPRTFLHVPAFLSLCLLFSQPNILDTHTHTHTHIRGWVVGKVYSAFLCFPFLSFSFIAVQLLTSSA